MSHETSKNRTMSHETSINIIANRLESDLTTAYADTLLYNIFHGKLNDSDVEALCTIVSPMEEEGIQSGAGGGNINKQQIPHAVGAKQKVQVGGNKNKELLKNWLDDANNIFNSSYRISPVQDDPVKVALTCKGENSDDYKNLKKLHIFLKLLILKTILEKTKIYSNSVINKISRVKDKKELLKRLCDRVDFHFGEFDVAAAMFIIFCGKTALQQFVTLSAMSLCAYSATYAPQICSLLFNVMQPATNLVKCLFELDLPTLIAGVFAAKSTVNAIQSFHADATSSRFPRSPQSPQLTRGERVISIGTNLFNFATDMSPVADVTLPRLSTLAKTMFAALVHIKQKATDALLDPVIRLFLDTFAGSDRIFQLASAKPEQFGNLLADVIVSLEFCNFDHTVIDEIEHNLQSSRLSSYHAIGVAAATPTPTPTHRHGYRATSRLGRSPSPSTASKGGSTTKSPQNMTKSTLKNRNAIKTMNKRYNRFRFHVSKNNSMLYKNRHRLLTSKNRKNKK